MRMPKEVIAARARERMRKRYKQLAPKLREWQRRYYHSHKAVISVRNSEYRLRRYGLSQAEYDLKLAAQGGGCAICGVITAGKVGRFRVDHDHSCCPGKLSCGKCVRGLLCDYCNRRGLPYVESGLADKARAYLTHWKEKVK